MKFTVTILALLLTGSAAHSLRSSNVQQDSPCNSARDKDSCFSVATDDNSPCSWCEAGAIPSECMSSEQASLLPSGVFDCSTPAAAAVTFSFARGHNNDAPPVKHTMRVSDKSDLCDPNVESIAGYMDIKGSEYDAKGEDKHLFFWMFEKRDNESSSSSSSDSRDLKESKDLNSSDSEGSESSSSDSEDSESSSNDSKDSESSSNGSKDSSSDSDDDATPFVVWLTGGPGCSSTLALLSENGPCKVDKDFESLHPLHKASPSTTINPYSWNEAAHVLWLDQPAGVGFSYGQETDSNEKMVAEDAYYFLQAFFQMYPKYQKSPLFIVGESYGGHYAPAIAHRVMIGNEQNKEDTIQLNLAGLGIGNGLTNPEEQYQYYAEMGFHNSHGIQVFDEATYDTMTAAIPVCTKMIHKCNSGDGVLDNFACQSAFIYCNTALTTPYRMTGLNPYDIRKDCGLNPLCYDFSHIEKFLNDKEVKKELNVDEKRSHAWASCNYGINMKFHTDWMKDFSPYVADLLNNGIPALIYAGDVDFICNYLGNQAWTYKLEWEGKEDFQNASVHEWHDGYGKARSAKGLTFLQVYDAGHMVPADQPKVALEMIKTFISDTGF